MEKRAEQRVSVELPKDVVVKFRDGCHADPGNHPWEKIYGHIMNFSLGEEIIVRWCPICGSVVVDTEVDGRVQPGAVRSIESPQIARQMSYKGV